MTTNVPCPTWIDQLIARRRDVLLDQLADVPQHARERHRGQIYALDDILGVLRMASIQSEK